MRKSQAETDFPKVKTVYDNGTDTEMVIGLFEDGRLYISIEEKFQDECDGDMCCIYISPEAAQSILLWLIKNQVGEK